MAKKPAKPQAKQRMVLFVHGIRDTGFWQQNLREQFEAEGFIAKPIGFHVFDLFRFLFGFRGHAVARVKQKIEAAIADAPGAEVTVIAHSFGTYVVSRILDEDPNIKFSRLVMCGAIVPRKYRWDKASRLNAQNGRMTVVNEFSARDFWPLFARHATFGFGDVGSIGCQDPDVEDRRHNIRHSEYLTEEFAKKFWLPWLARGEALADPKAPDANPWYFAVNRMPVTVIAGVLGAAFIAGAYVVNDRNNFRTSGTLEYTNKAGVTFEIVGHRRKDREEQETVYSAQSQRFKTRHALFSETRFQTLDVTIKNRIPVQCNTAALEDAVPAERNEFNQTVFEFDLSDAYHVTGTAQVQFYYEDRADYDGKMVDRLTLFTGDGIDPGKVRLLKVTHTGDECLDDSFKSEETSPFAAIKPLKNAPKGLFSSLIPDAFAEMLSKKPDPQEIKDFLGSNDSQLNDFAIQTIIANPQDYTAQVNAMVQDGNPTDDRLAALILAARNASNAPIKLDPNRIIELSYAGSGKVRDAARSYLRNAGVVDDGVAAAAQSAIDSKLGELRRQSVEGNAFGRDYLLLVAARDIYYNLGFKKLNAYREALRASGNADFEPVRATFEKGRRLRDLAASSDQRIALSKNTYGLAYSLYVAAMNRAAMDQGRGANADEFVDQAIKETRPLNDAEAANAFAAFLEEVSRNTKIYPWPAHIEQASRCTGALVFGCLDQPPAAN